MYAYIIEKKWFWIIIACLCISHSCAMLIGTGIGKTKVVVTQCAPVVIDKFEVDCNCNYDVNNPEKVYFNDKEIPLPNPNMIKTPLTEIGK